MIKIEKIEVFGFEGALRGMRNPLDSWDKADTVYNTDGSIKVLGPNDMALIKRLTKAGTSHRKFLRMIHIQADITAPLYWWKEYDTYKIATTGNSCSTMHKIHEYEFTMDMFTAEYLDKVGFNILDSIINYLNFYRKKFLDSGKKDKDAWYKMVQMLPTSYMQKRTVDLNYENVLGMLKDRHLHKQDEWCDFSNVLYSALPYMDMIYKAAYGCDMPMKAKSEREVSYNVKFRLEGWPIYNASSTNIILPYDNDITAPYDLRDRIAKLLHVNIDIVKLLKYEKRGTTSTDKKATPVDWSVFKLDNNDNIIKIDDNECPSNMFPDFSAGVIKSGVIKCDSISFDSININTKSTALNTPINSEYGLIAKMVEENIKKEISKAVNVNRNHQ